MRDYKLYLDDMLQAIKSVEVYTKGFNLNKLKQNRLVVDAVIRNLEIIGEASKKIPAEIKKRHKDIEWKKIAGLRDILAHEYFAVDLPVLWDVITGKLPDLKKQIEHIRKES